MLSMVYLSDGKTVTVTLTPEEVAEALSRTSGLASFAQDGGGLVYVNPQHVVRVEGYDPAHMPLVEIG